MARLNLSLVFDSRLLSARARGRIGLVGVCVSSSSSAVCMVVFGTYLLDLGRRLDLPFRPCVGGSESSLSSSSSVVRATVLPIGMDVCVSSAKSPLCLLWLRLDRPPRDLWPYDRSVISVMSCPAMSERVRTEIVSLSLGSFAVGTDTLADSDRFLFIPACNVGVADLLCLLNAGSPLFFLTI